MSLNQIEELACGMGWNRPSHPNPEQALALLKAHRTEVEQDLVLACLAGDSASVRVLIESGADVTARLGSRKWPPLLYLSYSLLHRPAPSLSQAMCETARLLLQAGADANASYEDEAHPGVRFPALYATIGVSRHLALAEVLLDAGASPSDGQSLYHACEWFDLAPLKLLGRYNLDSDDISYCIKHVLDMGYMPGVLWFLEQGADPNAPHPGTGENTLHWAVSRGATLETIREIVSAGANPNARSHVGSSAYNRYGGGTPLDLALFTGQLGVAALLRQAGGIPSNTDREGAFLQACAGGNEKAARDMLAERPQLIDELDPVDRARIADVAQVGSVEGVRLMLDLGFDPNVGGWMGATALHWAVCLGKMPLLKLLLERDVDHVDIGGDFGTPLKSAVHCQWGQCDYAEVVERLLRAGAQIPDGLFPCGQESIDRVVSLWQRQGS